MGHQSKQIEEKAKIAMNNEKDFVGVNEATN